MTPERRRDFETEWPELAGRLHRMLARRGLPASARDDVVQETAARLYGAWEDVDRSRPAWPLCRAIALNHLRDQARRKFQEIATEIPEVAHHHNVEDAGLARVELTKVRDALSGFSPQARDAVLVEVGLPRSCRASAAEKMQRMRARKKLRTMIERVPAAISLRLARITEFGDWLIGGRTALNGGLSCIACAAIGVAAVLPGSSSAAALIDEKFPRASIQLDLLEVSDGGRGPVALSIAEERSLVSSARPSSAASETAGAKKKQRTRSQDPGHNGGFLPGTPAPPPLPTSGAGPMGPEVPPAPEAPSGGESVPQVPGIGGPGEGATPLGVLSEAGERVEELL